jgi:hypothetical protein
MTEPVFRRGRQNDLSFQGVGPQLEAEWEKINNAPLGEEQLEFGWNFVAKSEERRLAAMEEYKRTKVAPS